MGIRKVNGFKFLDGLSSDYIVVEDNRIEEYIDLINRENIKSVSVNSLYYKKDEIRFLEKCPRLEKINVVSDKIKNFTPLYNLQFLKNLIIEEPDGEVDLSLLHQLEELRMRWNKHVKGLDKCVKLKTIALRKYKPKSNDLEEISGLREIEELILTQTRITSFAGWGGLPKLTKLEINYDSKLECIDELEKNSATLKSLRFYSCKKIKNHEYVTCLKELELLSFNTCGEIPSIGFIRELPKLKSFIFVDTNIVDGDLSSCIGLEHVGFFDKKHYSHNSAYFEANRKSV